MTRYDIFNGDADGICALLQLRHANPQPSQLITGIKRDISLLRKASISQGDKLTILDISLDKNRNELEAALANGAEVLYIDHHFAGEIPDHPKLTSLIDTTPDVCTSILVDRYLDGQFTEWAIVGAFGDNLKKSATALCEKLGLSERQRAQLENLGIYINYNGYGGSLDDLHFKPDELYRHLARYKTPFDFIDLDSEDFEKLSTGYHNDMASAAEVDATYISDAVAVFILPDATWARRVSGVYGNSLANQAPDRAHAVLTEKDNGNYLVSIRAPINNKKGADEVCRQFKTGGGRAAAAGINDLPSSQLQQFIDTFNQYYGS